MSRTLATPTSPGATRLQVAARTGAAVLGGYAFAWGLVALATSLLFAAGLEFHDAEFSGAVLGLAGYLVAFLWAFAARRAAVAWLVLAGGGAVMAAAASFVQSLLA